MAAKNYKGKKITGTSTTAKVFKKSGVSNAKKKDTYTNTDTGHVYECTTAGKPDTAKWKYTKTIVIAKPDLSVDKYGNLTRAGYKFSASWAIPSKLVDKKNGRRATELSIDWFLGIKGKDPCKVADNKNEKATSSAITLNNNFKIGKKVYNRAAFHPVTNGAYLDYISCKVNPQNAKGHGSKPITKKFDFLKPRKPTISAGSFNASNGIISFTITTNAGTDAYERYDTEWKYKVKTQTSDKWNVERTGSSTNTSITLTYDASAYQSMNNDQYIQMKVWARARGFQGNSDWVEKEFFLAFPALVNIKSTTPDAKTGRTVVSIDTTASIKAKNETYQKAHKAEGVRLCTLVNVTYSKASDIPGDEQGTETDVIDNGSCSALAINTSALTPEKGKHTYVRVKSWRTEETILNRYTTWTEVKALYVAAPTAADDRIVIASVTPGDDGKSLVCQLAWDDGSSPSTGTELTWSTDENSWKSTRDPDKYEFTWYEGRYSYKGVTYPKSAKITIKDLDENTKYFVKARRYLEGEPTTFSGYASSSGSTGEIPESLVASCDRYIPKGSSLLISWTYSGNGIQKMWKITNADGSKIYAEGNGSIGSTVLSASILNERAVNGTATFLVWASTGSDFIPSQTMTVTILNAPTVNLSASTPLTAQPLSFNVTASSASDLVVIVTSNGISGQFASGVKLQAEGDTIYSDEIKPNWTISDGSYTATITLPAGLDFWDGGKYTISVVAIDRTSGLKSDETTATISIEWAHQAPSLGTVYTYTATSDTEVNDDKNYYQLIDNEYVVVTPEGSENPSAEGWYEQSTTDYVTITPLDYTDENGVHYQAAEIALTPPAGYVESDLYDIYRMTIDGPYLIGQSFPLTYTAKDEYAPFSDGTLSYRVAIRTVDGDEAFFDYEYVLDSQIMRFDWQSGSLELPYNINIGESYKKDVDIRKHMDGGVDGYWNPNITRTGKFNSSIVQIAQPDEEELARRLGRYAGPVFVRLPNGAAFEADIQVSDLSAKNSHMLTIAIDATEVDLTEEFMLPTPYNLEQEEE